MPRLSLRRRSCTGGEDFLVIVHSHISHDRTKDRALRTAERAAGSAAHMDVHKTVAQHIKLVYIHITKPHQCALVHDPLQPSDHAWLHSKWNAQCDAHIVEAMGTIAQQAPEPVGVATGDPSTGPRPDYDRNPTELRSESG